MQAITTKYLGPTNFRGARIKASCEAGSISAPFGHELRIEERHGNAVAALLEKLGWYGAYVGGYQKGSTYVWVPLPKVLAEGLTTGEWIVVRRREV